uniref:Solute carrier family 66 member 2 n=1 Tax=Phlebotomus kandelakii TaxID=1109342 RepID=A0A6B2EFD2_9DIPT
MDWIINDELGLTLGHVVGWAAASAMVIGGVIPYIPQYRQIKQTQDPEGFSLHVCLALLIANTLRILFWFSKRYELPLLVQSIVMNLTMFLMIHLCVKVRRNNAIMRTRERVFSGEDLRDRRGSSKSRDERIGIGDGVITAPAGQIKRGGSSSKHYLTDFDMKYFWQWTDFQSYLDFMLVVWAVGAAITYLMLSMEWFMETMGFFAVFTEAMLGAPQFMRNYHNKSTHGMSLHMVIMWTLGDVFKTVYFVLRSAPTQFWVCGSLQVSLDLAILLQVYIYRKNQAPRTVHRGD